MKNLLSKNLANLRPVDRVAAIVIKGDEILLMHRINKGKKYNTFPGGGIDSGESRQEALIRECREETSIEISVKKMLYEVDWDHTTKQFFYLCEYIKGFPTLGDANEKEEMKNGNQYYEPYWSSVADLKKTLVYPLEVKDMLVYDLDKGFDDKKKYLYLELKTCRQTL